MQTIEVRNGTASDVTGFTLRDPRGYGFNFGGLAPNVPRGYGGRMKVKSTDVYSATWADATGQIHQAKVDLRKEMPDGVRGDVTFILNEDGTVSVQTRNQTTKN